MLQSYCSIFSHVFPFFCCWPQQPIYSRRLLLDWSSMMTRETALKPISVSNRSAPPSGTSATLGPCLAANLIFFFFLRRVRTWRRSRHFTTVVCWSCPWEPKTCRYLRYCTDGCRHTLTATWAICVCSIWIGRRRFDLKIEISRALLNAMDKFHSQMSNNGGGTARQAAKKDDVCLRLWKAFGRRRKGTQKSAIISSVVDTRRVERLWERSSEVHTRAEVLQTVTPVEKSLTVGDLKAKGQRSGQ